MIMLIKCRCFQDYGILKFVCLILDNRPLFPNLKVFVCVFRIFFLLFTRKLILTLFFLFCFFLRFEMYKALKQKKKKEKVKQKYPAQNKILFFQTKGGGHITSDCVWVLQSCNMVGSRIHTSSSLPYTHTHWGTGCTDGEDLPLHCTYAPHLYT